MATDGGPVRMIFCFAWIHRCPYQFYWFQNWLESIGWQLIEGRCES